MSTNQMSRDWDVSCGTSLNMIFFFFLMTKLLYVCNDCQREDKQEVANRFKIALGKEQKVAQMSCLCIFNFAAT